MWMKSLGKEVQIVLYEIHKSCYFKLKQVKILTLMPEICYQLTDLPTFKGFTTENLLPINQFYWLSFII